MSSSSSSTLPSWDVLNRKARNLESMMDVRLTRYSQLASQITKSIDPTLSSSSSSSHTTLDMTGGSTTTTSHPHHHRELETEIDSLLNQLSESIDGLTTILDDPTIPPTTQQLHAIQRHREVLIDFTSDFQRSKTHVRHAIDRRDLLGTVRDDIHAYKVQYASDQDALLAERNHIDQSHKMIDQTLEQAYSTRSEFASQSTMLTDLSHRINSTATQIPALNSLITLIRRRRTRDTVILSLLISVCTVLLLMFVFR